MTRDSAIPIPMSWMEEEDRGWESAGRWRWTLALDPAFVVCDEPVSALDVSIQAQVLNLLQDLQEKSGVTYMFVTHDLSVVKHISDHICVMYLGQLVETTGSRELFAHPVHPYTKALLSAIPSVDIHHKRERILLQGEIVSPV